jgi:membrane-associated phospholipid phosphatase
MTAATEVATEPWMDGIIFLVMALASILTYVFMEPHRRGFWTNDISIQYPYRPLTVSLTSILCIAFLGPFLTIIFVEKVLHQRASWTHIRKYAFTIVSTILMNLYVKFAVGRLRPHFIAVCGPSPEVMATKQFVTDYTCDSNVKARDESQARQSFYSGHAAYSVCAAVYLILFLQDRLRRSLKTSFLQLVILMIGIYPGITQVNNYWHHCSDVLFGYFAGALFAYLGYFHV